MTSCEPTLNYQPANRKRTLLPPTSSPPTQYALRLALHLTHQNAQMAPHGYTTDAAVPVNNSGISESHNGTYRRKNSIQANARKCNRNRAGNTSRNSQHGARGPCWRLHVADWRSSKRQNSER